MSENLQGHLIKIKVGDEWVDIPMSVINVYNIYTAYCVQKGITPVSEDTYYEVLGNLETYMQQLTGLSNLSSNIEELVNALSAGVLSVDKGGTGKEFPSEAALIQWFKNVLNNNTSETNTDYLVSFTDLSSTRNSILSEVDNVKLNKNAISWGPDNPEKVKPTGDIYFQHKA